MAESLKKRKEVENPIPESPTNFFDNENENEDEEFSWLDWFNVFAVSVKSSRSKPKPIGCLIITDCWLEEQSKEFDRGFIPDIDIGYTINKYNGIVFKESPIEFSLGDFDWGTGNLGVGNFDWDNYSLGKSKFELWKLKNYNKLNGLSFDGFIEW
jgi:hypothetical protein